MPTEGPARAIRGPIPVNSPLIPPSLIQAKSLRLVSYASNLEDQNINFNIGIKHVLNGIILRLKFCINEILDAIVIWNRTVCIWYQRLLHTSKFPPKFPLSSSLMPSQDLSKFTKENHVNSQIIEGANLWFMQGFQLFCFCSEQIFHL